MFEILYASSVYLLSVSPVVDIVELTCSVLDHIERWLICLCKDYEMIKKYTLSKLDLLET